MVAFFSHLNGVQNAQILNLIVGNSVHKGERFFLFIRFNTANEMKICIVGHLTDKFFDLFSNFNPQIFLVRFVFHHLQFFFKDTFDNR
jgi:hypothetical protein